MKFLTLLISILFVSCAHKKTNETCKTHDIIQMPIKLAQCFNHERQPLKALSLFEKYSSKISHYEWDLVEFDSLILLNKENLALTKLNKQIQKNPHEQYFFHLLEYFSKTKQQNQYDMTLSRALEIYPNNEEFKKLTIRES